MPLLKRLLRAEELGDAREDATAEQLFASSIHSQDLRIQRRLAAALCSAPLVNMASISTHQLEQIPMLGDDVSGAYSIDNCVASALMVAKEGWQVLFLVSDSKLVTKRLAAAVSRPKTGMSTESAAECLHRVRFRQTRSVYDLLCELDRVQQNWKEKPDPARDARTRIVAVGPLCDLLSPFQTATGMTTSGAGLKRMVDLAIKRLRATTSIRIIVIEPN